LDPGSAAAAPLLVSPRILRVEPGTESCLTKFLVKLAFLRIAQHVVSERDFFEAFFSRFVAGVDVRMVLPG